MSAQIPQGRSAGGSFLSAGDKGFNATNKANEKLFNDAMDTIRKGKGQSVSDKRRMDAKLASDLGSGLGLSERGAADLIAQLTDISATRTRLTKSDFAQLQSGVTAMHQANQAATQGFYGDLSKDIAGQEQARYQQAVDLLSGRGTQARADVRELFRNEQGGLQQRLTSQGLAGTTVAGTMRSGIKEAESEEIRRLNESLRDEELKYRTQLSGEAIGRQVDIRGQEGSSLTGLRSQEALSMQNIGLTEQQNLFNIGQQNSQLTSNIGAQALSDQANLRGQGMGISANIGQSEAAANMNWNMAQLDLINSVENVGPDPNLFAQYGQSLGQATGGSPGGGGGGTLGAGSGLRTRNLTIEQTIARAKEQALRAQGGNPQQSITRGRNPTASENSYGATGPFQENIIKPSQDFRTYMPPGLRWMFPDNQPQFVAQRNPAAQAATRRVKSQSAALKTKLKPRI